MGIYLPNMEMPQKNQMLVIFPDGTSYVCFNGMRERLTQTTAVPVPPHGDLIDKKTVSENFAKVLSEKKPPFSYPDWNDAIIAVLTAPTIIESEGDHG